MYELQIAIDDALLAQGMTVYDRPPQVSDPSDNSAFPYVVIGETTSQPWDTDTETGQDVTMTIHTWSVAGFLELKTMQTSVYNALHRQAIDVQGWHVLGCDEVDRNQIRDPDGVTVHGIQTYRVVMEPASGLLVTGGTVLQ
jgi:hypothetical protein